MKLNVGKQPGNSPLLVYQRHAPLRFDYCVAPKNSVVVGSIRLQMPLKRCCVWDICIRVIDEEHKVVAALVIAISLYIVVKLAGDGLSMIGTPDIFHLHDKTIRVGNEVFDIVPICDFISGIFWNQVQYPGAEH